MSSSKMRKSLEFVGGSKVTGLPNASSLTDAVPKQQLDTVAATKQDNLTGGSGIDLTGSTLKVNLAVSGNDYESLTLSGFNYASLDGVYSLASFKGSLSYFGTSLNLDVGGDYNVYQKDNGGGVWSIIAKRDTDNIHNNGSVGESSGYWIAVLTSVDPTSITEDYNNFIPNYQAVDYDFLTASSEQDDNGNGTVSSSASGVSYASGNTPAGLIFENDKLAIDFADNLGDAESTNVLPASVAATAISEAEARASQAQNTTFSNAIAQLDGNPSKVQSAIEAVKNEINAVSGSVSSNQTIAASEYSNIDGLQAALGTLTANMGVTHATLSDSVTAKALINELAVLIAALRADAAASLGLSTGSLVGDIGSTVTNGSNLIAALTSIVSAIETVQGDLTSRIGAVSFFHNGEEFPLTAGQAAGTEALDIVKTGAGTGEENDVAAYVAALDTPRDVRLLISYGTTGDEDAGIYVRDKNTGYITRAADFDEASEIEQDDVVQVLLGGSTAFADFRVANDSAPIVGADPIKFELYKASGVGDNQVTKAKIDDVLLAEFEALPRQESFSVTVPANGSVTVTHGLIKESPFTIYDAAGNELTGSFEVDATVAGQLTISSEDDAAIGVTVTVVGKRI